MLQIARFRADLNYFCHIGKFATKKSTEQRKDCGFLVIVFDIASHRRSLVCKGPLSAFEEELNKKATWYLVDTKEPSLYDAKTILTTSPRREIWKVILFGPTRPCRACCWRVCYCMA